MKETYSPETFDATVHIFQQVSYLETIAIFCLNWEHVQMNVCTKWKVQNES